MGRDIHLIKEVKKNGVWQPIWKESVLQYTNFISLVFCREPLCGWYEDKKVPFIHDSRNGSPKDISKDTEEYLMEGSWEIHGFVTKADIENFNWDFNIPYDFFTTPEQAKEFFKTGNFPKDYKRTGEKGTDGLVPLTAPFKTLYKDWFEELKELGSLGEDYRYLYYFE